MQQSLRQIHEPRAGEPADTFTCWDSLDDLEERADRQYYKCNTIGMTREKNAFGNLLDEVDYRISHDQQLPPLRWSDPLALSASMFLKQIEGCSVYANQLWRDGNEHEFLSNFADFEEHDRFFIYPEQFDWVDNREFAFDVLFDDRDLYHELRLALLTGYAYREIGIACNCDNEWGQVCIVELGKDVVVNSDYDDFFSDRDNAYFPLIEEDALDGYFRRRSLNDIIPEFRLAGHPECPTGNTHRYCNQTYDSSYDYNVINEYPEVTVHSLQQRTHDFSLVFWQILNQIRDTNADDSPYLVWDYQNDEGAERYTPHQNLDNPYALDELYYHWPDYSIDTYNWNEALARAAEHVANIEGPCMTDGDQNGDQVEQVLAKYYAYDFHNLQVLKVESTELIQEGEMYGSTGSNHMSALKAIEYILSQENIDKSIFRSEEALEFGMGCSCSARESPFPENPFYLCYFLLARNVTAKYVVENLPQQQMFLQGQQKCRSKCPFYFGRSGTFTDPDRCYGEEYTPYEWQIDVDDVVDRNGWCKACDELVTKCSDCNQQVGCQECTNNQGYSWPSTYLNAGYGLCFAIDCAERLNKYDQERCAKCHVDYDYYNDRRLLGNLPYDEDESCFDTDEYTTDNSYVIDRFYQPFENLCVHDCTVGDYNLEDPFSHYASRRLAEDDWDYSYSELTCECRNTYIMAHDEDSCFACRSIDPFCIDCEYGEYEGEVLYTCEECEYDMILMPDQEKRLLAGQTEICEPKLEGCKILEEDQPGDLPEAIDQDEDGFKDWWCPACRDGWVLDVDNYPWRCKQCEEYFDHCTRCVNGD